VRVTTGDAACLVISEHPAVLDWITMYLGSWWTVTPTPATSGDPERLIHKSNLMTVTTPSPSDVSVTL